MSSTIDTDMGDAVENLARALDSQAVHVGEDVRRLFKEATNENRLAGNEARRFFRRTGLPSKCLRQVWGVAKRLSPSPGREEHGLSLHQFETALRLSAIFQEDPFFDEMEAQDRVDQARAKGLLPQLDENDGGKKAWQDGKEREGSNACPSMADGMPDKLPLPIRLPPRKAREAAKLRLLHCFRGALVAAPSEEV